LTDRVVVDASPLIALFRAGRAELLGQLWPEIAIPGAVWREVLAGGFADRAARDLPEAPWARRVEVAAVPSSIVAWNLGAGESEVLAFALENPRFIAMVDDAESRRCARALGIPVLGTGGTLVLAKRRGLIGSVRTLLDELRAEGLWLSEEVINLLLQAAGEDQP
jgi:predicted nucleic acid-binding protein